MQEFEGQKREIEIRYDQNRAFSYAVTPPTDGITNPRVYLAKSAIINSDSNEVFTHETVVRIISHELGHIFANFLGISNMAWQLTISPLNEAGQSVNKVITATGGASGSPLVIEGYLQFTQSYFAGINADLGSWYRLGGFQFGDDNVDALTKTNYAQFVTISSCANCNTDNFLVDVDGNCIPNSNNECIAPDPSTAQSEAIYARLPGTYIPNFANMPDAIRNTYFTNEMGETTENSAPKEGYADLFKVGMVVEGGITILPSTEPRRMFFEEFIGKWLFQLLAEWIPENEVSQCVD